MLRIMAYGWDASAPGVLRLPSGRLIRGRGLRLHVAEGSAPNFGLYLSNARPAPIAWQARWVLWPDFRLPRDRRDAADALREAWLRAQDERVEVACSGGRGRTGTALACIAALDGVPTEQAVAFVREHYDAHAVETPWQRRYAATILDRVTRPVGGSSCGPGSGWSHWFCSAPGCPPTSRQR